MPDNEGLSIDMKPGFLHFVELYYFIRTILFYQDDTISSGQRF